MSYEDPAEINRLLTKEREHNGPLKSALRNILADKSILADAEATEIQLRMEIFNDTRIQPTTNDQTLLHTNQGGVVRIYSQQIIAGRREETPINTQKHPDTTSTEKVLNTLRPIKMKIQEELTLIRREYRLFQRNLLAFISVLKVAKPPDMNDITSQADLLRCYINLKSMPNTQKAEITGHLQEYMSLLDSLAEFCDEIHKDFLHWESDSNMEGISEKEMLLPLAEKLNNMLDPTYHFSNQETEEIVILHEDHAQFKGLLNFMPLVINRLDELLQILSIQIDTRQRQLFDVNHDYLR